MGGEQTPVIQLSKKKKHKTKPMEGIQGCTLGSYAQQAHSLEYCQSREASKALCVDVKIMPAHLRPVCRDGSWIVFLYS